MHSREHITFDRSRNRTTIFR